jgi:hypothetical protein
MGLSRSRTDEWLKHIRADRTVAYPRDIGRWRGKLLTQAQYLTACRHAHRNRLELFTSVYSQHEVENQLITELFYDIDLEARPPAPIYIHPQSILSEGVQREHSSTHPSSPPTCSSSSSHPSILPSPPFPPPPFLSPSAPHDVLDLVSGLGPLVSAVRTVFSGRRGIHLHVDLDPVRVSDLRGASLYVAEALGIADLVDRRALGDWRRLCRVPGSYHGSTGAQCISLSLETNPELRGILSQVLHERFPLRSRPYSLQMPPEVKEVFVELGEPPPCASFLLSKLLAGEDLPHEARLHLGSYLMKLGLTPEEASVLFSRLPDFRERVTLYQLRWMGSRGYMMYSCKRAKELGLCPHPLDICRYYPSPNLFFR